MISYFNLIYQLFKVVSEISTNINDDTKEYIKKEMMEPKPFLKLWGDNIQCHYIPYTPVKKKLAKLTSKPAVDSSFVNDFSMKYSTDSDKNNVERVQPRQEPKVVFTTHSNSINTSFSADQNLLLFYNKQHYKNLLF